jgi:hypothetical protein
MTFGCHAQGDGNTWTGAQVRQVRGVLGCGAVHGCSSGLRVREWCGVRCTGAGATVTCRVRRTQFASPRSVARVTLM